MRSRSASSPLAMASTIACTLFSLLLLAILSSMSTTTALAQTISPTEIVLPLSTYQFFNVSKSAPVLLTIPAYKDNGTLSISVTPRWGGSFVHLAIGTISSPPTVNGSLWNGPPFYNGEPVMIDTSDPNWPIDNVFFALVYVPDWVSLNDTFNMMAWARVPTTPLEVRMQEAVQVHLTGGETAYFQMNTSYLSGQPCTLMNWHVTRISGNTTDTTAVYSLTQPMPIAGRDGVVGPFGADSIASYRVSVPFADQTGMVYFAVTASAPTTFTVMPSHGCSYLVDDFPAHVFLRNGVPQYLEIDHGVSTLGTFNMMSFQPLLTNDTILLSVNLYGTFGTFYVTTNANGVPSSLNYIWSSSKLGANHMIVIGANDTNRCANSSCWYYMTAVPDNEGSFPFLVTVTQRAQFTKLQNGAATAGFLWTGDNSNQQSFEVSIDRPNSRFFLQVQPIVYFTPSAISATSAVLSVINPAWKPDNMTRPTLLDLPLTWNADVFGVYVRPDNYSSLCTPSPTVTCRFLLTISSSAVISYSVMYTDSPLTLLTIGEKVTHFAMHDPIYLRFFVQAGYRAAVLEFTTLTGHYDVYVSNKLTLPVPDVPSTYQFSITAAQSSDPVFRISESDANACDVISGGGSCFYTVAVVPRFSNYTSFTVLAYIANTTNTLTDGEPVYGVASPDSPDYWVLFVPPSQSASMRNVRVMLSGRNASAYVSLTEARPSPQTTPMNMTVLDWYNHFTLRNQNVSVFYIAVYAYEYTLLVYTEDAQDETAPTALTPLTLGRPLRDSLFGNRTRNYVVDLSGEVAAAFMIVQLNEFSGRAVWYAAPCANNSVPLPSPTNSVWNSDPKWPSLTINLTNVVDTRFCIAVYGVYETAPSYSIAVTMVDAMGYDTIYRLEDSRYTYSYIAPFQVRTYALDVPAPRDADVVRQVRIGLTSLLGDAEMFVTCGNLSWSLSNYTWRGFDAGASSIVIHERDSRACPPPTTYYIRVYPHEASAVYTLHATAFGNTTVMEMPSRVAVNFATPADNVAYFFYRPHVYENGRGITLTASPSYGAAYLYVSAFNMLNISGAASSFVPPSAASSMWQSLGDFSGSILDISHSDPNLCSIPANFSFPLAPGDLSPCVYVIAVSTRTMNYNFSLPSQYTLLASAHTRDAANDTERPAYISGYVHTANHAPVYRYTPNDTVHYYTVIDIDPASEFFVTLTPISGIVELIVGDADYPNATSHFFSSFEENTHTFQWAKNATDYTFVRLVAAVRAYSNATYTIVVGQVPLDRPGRFPTRLNDALPQYDTLSEFRPDTWRYYVYYLPVSNVTLSISIPRRMGDVEAYIAYEPFNELGYLSSINALFPTDQQGTYNDSMIHHSFNSHQYANAPAGRYVIGVHASVRTDYLIQVTASLTGTVLLFDSPMIDTIVPDPWFGNTTLFGVRRYKLEIPDVLVSKYFGLDLVINLAHFAGHTRLTLSNSSQPFPDPTDPTTYMYMSEEIRLNTIRVPASQVAQGLYWLTVFGETPTTYTISATFFAYQELLMGVQQNAYVPPSSWQYYHVVVAGRPFAHDVLLTATQMHGRVAMYVVDVTKQLVFPNTTYFDAAVNWTDSGVQALRINNTCMYHRCTYLIGVQAWSTSPARYNILAEPTAGVVINNASTLIQPTVPTMGRSPHNLSHVAHYAFRVMTPSARVSLALTDLGSAGLQIGVSGTEYPVFDPSTRTMTGMNMLANDTWSPVISFTSNSTGFKIGTYFVTVATAFDSSAIYTLSLFVDDLWLPPWASSKNASAVYLIDGQPQAAVIPRSYATYAYWEFVSPASTVPITVTVDSLSPLDVVLYARWDAQIPTPTFYQSMSYSNSLLFLNPSDSTGKYGCPAPASPTAAPCKYIVAAYRNTASSSFNDVDLGMRLTAYQAAKPLLNVGVQTDGFVPANQSQTYGLLLSQNDYLGQQLSIVLTPSTLCYAWANITQYVNGTAVYSAYTRDTDGVHSLSLTLPTTAELMRTDWYFEVSVSSFQSCPFTLLAATNNTGVLLMDEIDVPFVLQPNATQLFITAGHLPRQNVSVAVISASALSAYQVVVTSNFSVLTPDGTDCVVTKFFANFDQEPLWVPMTSCLAAAPFWFVHVTHYGASAGAFRMRVHVDENMETLIENVVLTSFVAPSDSRLYRYALDASGANFSTSALKVSVTTLSVARNVTLCASTTNKAPAPGTDTCNTNGDWAGTSVSVAVGANDQYVYVAVYNMDSAWVNFRVQAALGVVEVERGYQFHDQCTPGTPNLYFVEVPPQTQVVFHVVAFDNSNGNPTSLYLRVGQQWDLLSSPTAGNTLWHEEHFQFGTVLTIEAADSHVQQCKNVTFPVPDSCVLVFRLDGCPSASTLSVTVSTDYFVVSPASLLQTIVNPFDVKFIRMSLIDVNVGATFVIEQCYGQTAAYLSFDDSRPSNTSYVSKADSILQPNTLTTTAIANASYANIAVYGDAFASSSPARNAPMFRFFSYPSALTPPTIPRSAGPTAKVVLVGDSSALSLTLAQVPSAYAGQTTLTYSVYYAKTSDPDVVLFTACGAESASLLTTVSSDDLDKIASNGVAQISLSALSGGSDNVYSFGVLVSYTNQTINGYTAYPVLGQQTLPSSNNKGAESSNHTAVIVLAVMIPIVLLLLGGFVYYFMRTRKLQQELNVELPEVDRSTSYRSQRRAVRGPDASSSFSRRTGGGGGGAGNDRYSSLLDDHDERGTIV